MRKYVNTYNINYIYVTLTIFVFRYFQPEEKYIYIIFMIGKYNKLQNNKYRIKYSTIIFCDKIIYGYNCVTTTSTTQMVSHYSL